MTATDVVAAEHTAACRLACQKQHLLVDQGNTFFSVQIFFPNYAVILPIDSLTDTVFYKAINPF